MKKAFLAIGAVLSTLLLVYGILVYCVFFYYEPRIEKEEARQEGWVQAIEELEYECRQVTDVMTKQRDSWGKQKTKLEQTVKVEKSRSALMEKGLEGRRRFGWSDYDWKRRTNERLAQAQKAFDNFRKDYKDDPKGMARLEKLRQQLEALRARQQKLQGLYENRDKLMVWPLPIIAPYFNKETNQKQEQAKWN